MERSYTKYINLNEMKNVFLCLCLCSALTAWAAPSTTVIRSSSAMADQYGWVHDGKPGMIVFNDFLSLSNEKPNDNCKYDANNKGIRFYQQCGYFTIEACEGAVIESIKLTYISSNNVYGTLTTDFGTDGYNIPVESRVVSGQEYAVHAQSIRLWTGSTTSKAADGGTGTRGTVRITDWEIVYSDTLSVIEGYKQLNTEMSAEEVKFVGDNGLYTWKVKNFQRKMSDKSDLVNGDLGVRVKYNGTKSEGYLAMDGNQEGGIKSISFDYHTTGNDMPIHFLVKEGSTTLDDYRHQAPASTSNVFNYHKELNLKTNTAISLVNPMQENPQQTFVVVGPMTIVPYLLFAVPNRMDNLSVGESGSYNLSDVLINNTGEEPAFTVERNTTGAKVAIEKGVLSMNEVAQSGEIDVKASWKEGAVFTTLTLSVDYQAQPSEGERVVETFSNCTDTEVLSGRIHVVGDNGLYDWSLARFQRKPAEDMVGEGQGIRIRYNGSIAMVSEQEGGIKEVSFDWRVSGDNMPIHYCVRVNNKEYEVKQDGVLSTKVMHYFRAFNVKQNTGVSISVPEVEDPAQTYVIVGPITIMPYLLFKVPNRIDTINVANTTVYDLVDVLIDNTDNEGEIVYEIVSDETGAATIDGSEIDLSKVEQSGLVAVKATWGEVTTTMSLWVIGVNPSGLVRPSAHSSQPYIKTIKDGQLRIYRGEECYSILGNIINK